MSSVAEVRVRQQQRMEALDHGVTELPLKTILRQAMYDVDVLLNAIAEQNDPEKSRLSQYLFDRVQQDLLKVLTPDGIPKWWDLEIPQLGDRTPRATWNDGDQGAVADLAASYSDPEFS